MSIRLNKVLTELNIGLERAVEFLKNKKSLGEIKDDANVNTKISDEQYQALAKAFKGDKDIKSEAESIFAKKAKDKKAENGKIHFILIRNIGETIEYDMTAAEAVALLKGAI